MHKGNRGDAKGMFDVTAYEEVQFHNREADHQARETWEFKGRKLSPPVCAGLLPAMTRWAEERLAREKQTKGDV